MISEAPGLRVARGVCPLCGKKQLAVYLNQQGRAVKTLCFYGRHPSRTILAALKGEKLDGFRQAAVETNEQKRTEDRAAKKKAAARLWEFSAGVRGTLGEHYLCRRGIRDGTWLACFKYNENVFHHRDGEQDYYYPALIACGEDSEGHFGGIHRTYLSYDTPDLKLHLDPQKAALGTGPGTIVRLTPYLSSELVLCEGIEDGLSIVKTRGLNVWATLGTNMKAVKLPDCVTNVTIAADNDVPGRQAAEKAARHFHEQGRMVRIAYPDAGCKDFNEELVQLVRADPGNSRWR